MPLFEYQCRECHGTVEVLIRAGDSLPCCPDCGSADIERLISMFAISSEESRKASLGIAKRKVQQRTRDKAIAEAEDIRNHRH
jgi:putative FmdB family regulatory protein